MQLMAGDALPAWGPDVFRGRYGDQDVAVVFGPDDGEPSAVEPWIGRAADGVWPLVAVVPSAGRRAHVYPFVAALSAGGLVDAELPPVAVATAIIGRLAAVLAALGADAHGHPGPFPEDVLIRAEGDVVLTGFVSASGERRQAPGNGGGEAALVYRLGALYAELLCGSHPSDPIDRGAHDQQLRRIVIRVLSRADTPATDRYRDWLQRMLAWDPSLRPPLARVAAELAAVTAELRGPSLADWAAAEGPERIRSALPRVPRRRTTASMRTAPREEVTKETEVAGMRTLPGFAVELPDVDDDTAVSYGAEPLPLPPRELGTIPVSVGPPAEVARRRPRLPAEIFSDEGAPARRTPATDGRRVLVVAAALLAVVAAVLAGWLFR